MQDVQAFVGHSFRPEDRALIQVFIDHFRTLAHSYPGFSWDHAEKAEAVPLAQKVLEKIDGKNVFIGLHANRASRRPKCAPAVVAF
jgi:hypothetical protein